MGFEVFETALGWMGIAWTDAGAACIQLPEGSRDATARRLRARAAHAAADGHGRPAWLGGAIRRLTRHLSGEPQSFHDVPLDAAAVPPFHAEVYAVCRGIAPGTTQTYGELARTLGRPGAARAVGQAMARNPFPIVVPCHRVLASGGKPGGFSAYGGLVTKERLLLLEGGAKLPTIGGRRRAAAKRVASRSKVGVAGALPYDVRAAVRALRKADPKLAALMDRVGPLRLRLKEPQSTLASLAEAIVYQQLAAKAAQTIHGRFLALFEGGVPTADALGALTDDQLRAAGLSRGKTAALRDLARRSLAGEVPEMEALAAETDTTVIERLTRVRGVGRWTVEMLLIFRLGRPDVLPVDDFGVRKGYQVAFKKRELPHPKALAAYGERWAPYRSLAAWYLWRALDLPAKRR
jgi:methylated-DNA-[protein]-cysteine S-methyltransferase